MKVIQEEVQKVLRPTWPSKTRGGVLEHRILLTPPLTLELREVVDLMPKGGV